MMNATPEEPNNNPDFVQSLARGLAVISAFSHLHPSMTLTEVAEQVGLTRASARRFLLTLESLGYVRQSGKEFSLTPKVLELGYTYLSGLGLTDILSPHLARLSTEVRQSASAAILDSNEIVYIARTAAQKIMQVQITIGTRFPAFATSMGRVLLAGKSDTEVRELLAQAPPRALTALTRTDVDDVVKEVQHVRTSGYAFVDQELEIGLCSIAVPVHNRQGLVVAAINISTIAHQERQHTIAELLDPLRECAERIENDLRSAGI